MSTRFGSRRFATLAMAAVVAVAAATFGAPGAGAQTTRAPAPDGRPLDRVVKVKILSSPSLTGAALFVAIEKGYFKAEKLDVEWSTVATGQDSQALAAAGRIDGYLGGLTAAFFNGVKRGLDVSLVGANGQTSASGEAQTAFLVKKDGPIKSVADLRGKKVVVPGGLGAQTGWLLHQLLKQGDLTVADVQVVNLGPGDGVAALANGAVHAAVDFYPGMAQRLADGKLVPIGDMAKAVKVGGGNGLVLGPRLTKDNRRAGVAFLRAMYRAAKDLQGPYNKDKRIVQILAKATNTPTWVIKQSPPPGFDRFLDISPELVADMQTFFRNQRFLNFAPNLKVNKLIDAGLIADARATTK